MNALDDVRRRASHGKALEKIISQAKLFDQSSVLASLYAMLGVIISLMKAANSIFQPIRYLLAGKARAQRVIAGGSDARHDIFDRLLCCLGDAQARRPPDFNVSGVSASGARAGVKLAKRSVDGVCGDAGAD